MTDYDSMAKIEGYAQQTALTAEIIRGPVSKYMTECRPLPDTVCQLISRHHVEIVNFVKSADKLADKLRKEAID